MSKITKSIFDTIYEICSHAEELGIAYQFAQNQFITGKELQINNQKVLNFSSCSYLGLETDERIKVSITDHVNRYGSQFSMTRAFLSVTPYQEAEKLLSKIFDAHVIITSSTSMGHQSVMPVVVNDNDLIILDHKVHASVQLAANMLKVRGVRVEMIRHNDITELEELIKSNQKKGRKIFYCIDGVYSMFGDFAPYDIIGELMDSYECLNLYIDDAHGMSWIGKHGRGYSLSNLKFSERIIMGTSLNKAFAASGGVFLFKDFNLREKVKYCGALNTFSGPIQPPMLGAIIASSKIHLSDDIYRSQENLQLRIEHSNKALLKSGLPLIEKNEAPIFFVGAGSPKVCFNLAKKVLNDGYFVSVGAFPAVPVKNTGIRFAINNHLSLEDIDGLVGSLKRNFPLAVSEEGKSSSEIYSLFNLKIPDELSKLDSTERKSTPLDYKVRIYNSVKEIGLEKWDLLAGHGNILKADDLLILEEVQSELLDEKSKCHFYYILIEDKKGKASLLSLITSVFAKDDMLSPVEVSKKVEVLRKDEPDYLVNRSLIMGTNISEARHFYLDKTNPDWKKVLDLFLIKLGEIQDAEKANSIYLRDFESESDSELIQYLFEEGFVKFKLPDSYSVSLEGWETESEYLQSLSARNRRHVKYEILRFRELIRHEIKESLSETELKRVYSLYRLVHERSFEINSLPVPFKVFQKLNESSNWEYVLVYGKDLRTGKMNNEVIAFALSRMSNEEYIPVIVGHDYRFLYTHANYRQCLYNVIFRAKKIGCKTVRLEMGAGIEKRKLGSEALEKIVMVQTKDTFSQELLFQLNVSDGA